MIRQDIQGLRAIAVLAVIGCHALPAIFPGGYVGVDIFFVISGYLISSLVFRDIEAGRFSLLDFYRRRIRRIFPALLVMIFVAMSVGFFILSPKQYLMTAWEALFAVFSASNFEFMRTTDYFAPSSAFRIFLHTWSLAVEEQFYLAFPIAAIWLWRDYRTIARILLVVGFFASLGLAHVLRVLDPEAAYFFAPSRAFELMVGVMIAAFNIRATSRRMCDALSIAGIGVMVATVFVFDENTPFPSYLTLVPCLGAAAVIVAGRNASTIGGRLLSVGPMRVTGDLSYSLYLWHWPILAYMRNWFGIDLGPTLVVSAFVSTFVLGYLSYRYVEQPFLHRNAKELPYLRLGVGSMAAFAALLVPIVALGGLPQRFGPESLKTFAAARDINPRRSTCHSSAVGPPVAFARSCRWGDETAAPDLAVWGDSHGTEIVVALSDHGLAGRSALQLTASACPPAMGYSRRDRPGCAKHNQEMMDGLLADSRIRTVVLATNIRSYVDDLDEILASLEETVRQLRAAGKAVVVILPIPMMDYDPPSRIGLAMAFGQDPSELGLPMEKYDAINGTARKAMMAMAAKYGALAYDPVPFLCDQMLCRAYNDKAGPLYFNTDHLDLVGANLVTAELQRQLYHN